ncbi:MAG: cytochrome c [Candidatus Eisenbacteria bacterium]|nr:cytochrome c [Candidatus Eisenbacteria bacterium]
MSYVDVKIVLGTAALASVSAALFSMLSLMGRSGGGANPATLKTVHRVSGYSFAALLALLAVFGIVFLRAGGDALPLRGVLHWAAGAMLIAFVVLKVLVARVYKQFLKYAPALGMTVFALAFLTAALSLGFVAATAGRPPMAPGRPLPSRDVEADPVAIAARNAEQFSVDLGEEIFRSHCASCHFTGSVDSKIGPGLAGLTAMPTMSATGTPPTRENIRAQILHPAGSMPAFESLLNENEVSGLLDYLETL